MRILIPIFSLVTTVSAWGLAPVQIPRASTKSFVQEGFFQGGSDKRLNLEGARLGKPDTNTERWVFDFSEPITRKKANAAPKFQLQYFSADKTELGNGEEFVQKPAKFLLLLRSIAKSHLTAAKVKDLVRKSHLVKEVVLYPPIDDGDLAMEIILKDDVAFEAHQPAQDSGRLVLDLKDRG